jgi:hypothetical protein
MFAHYDSEARAVLQELREGKSEKEYADLIWAQRYPTASAKAGNGWPYKKSVGIEEAPKLRKVK